MKRNIFYRENNSIKGFYSSREDCYNSPNTFSITRLTTLYYRPTIKVQGSILCLPSYEKSRN